MAEISYKLHIKPYDRPSWLLLIQLEISREVFYGRDFTAEEFQDFVYLHIKDLTNKGIINKSIVSAEIVSGSDITETEVRILRNYKPIQTYFIRT